MTTYIHNRKATFNYEILNTYEAGLILVGAEVKSIRAGKAKLEGSYIVVRGGEVYVVGLSITPYQPLNTPKSYDPERLRKLLLSKKEVLEIERNVDKDRLTAIPIKLYSVGSKIKLEVAIAKGKNQRDKRESLKARDTKRDIERTLKSQ